MAEQDWTPEPYVSGAQRPRGEGSIFDPNLVQAATDGPRAFVTGWPVWHSRSPLIHRAWLKQFGLPGSYDRVGVPPEEIGEFFRTLRRQGFVGGNVTLPHKLAALEAVARRDAAAEATPMPMVSPPTSMRSCPAGPMRAPRPCSAPAVRRGR
jgi:shikimate dehydrogenase